ncbi:MAG: carboxypeptidase-like regulatory domain-containing protein [Salinivirgaceae bacterium]|nr:carboxypeptidase-like regulatory domain-containing protein [Salinivirgaceae bacterium]
MVLRRIAQIVVVLLIAAGSCMAQTDILGTTVSINTNNKTLKQILTEIESKSGVQFSYSDNLLPKQKYSKVEQQPNLRLLLDKILKPNNIDYRLIDNQIVLFETVRETGFYYLSGFLNDQKSSENIINGAVYIDDIGTGTITNTYGYFSIKLPAGVHRIKFYSLGYEGVDTIVSVRDDMLMHVRLAPKSYQMAEIVVRNSLSSDFMESALSNIAKMNISKLKEMPNILGEHDALRNLDMLPGMQISEFSTSSIYTRGGTSDQTTFMMDEAEIFSPSHFGGASIYNPDVINHIDIYKNELPASESGALSSVVDVRLRDGDMQQWHASGSMGLLTARLLAEGPVKKNKSSVLLAVRRTYADGIAKPVLRHYNVNMSFYFYDVNFKFNYIFNDRNRLYLSWYSGADKIDHYIYLKRSNYLGTARYYHIFGDRLFCNLTFSGGLDRTSLSNFHYKGDFKWTSLCWNGKSKLDFTYNINRNIKLKYGYNTTIYSLEPFDLDALAEPMFSDQRINAQTITQSGIYTDQTYNIGSRLMVLAGLRLNQYEGPATISFKGADTTFFYTEWNLTANYRASERILFKFNVSRKQKPIHQLQVSSYGITINRWMPVNRHFGTEQSLNMSASVFYELPQWLNVSASIYRRKLKNMIETLQDMRLIYEIDPERFSHHASAIAAGCELTCNAMFDNFRLAVSYDYTNSEWQTNGLNDGKPYSASFIRKHSFNINGRYNLNRRMWLAASWQLASGIPYTAAIGKYVIDNKTVLQFDIDNINTKRLPSYHRLDISLDIEGKNNDTKRWKSYWNFAIYNVYAHKNPLGIAYFITDEQGTERLNPGFYYFYQFVPSISYKFVF